MLNANLHYFVLRTLCVANVLWICRFRRSVFHGFQEGGSSPRFMKYQPIKYLEPYLFGPNGRIKDSYFTFERRKRIISVRKLRCLWKISSITCSEAFAIKTSPFNFSVKSTFLHRYLFQKFRGSFVTWRRDIDQINLIPNFCYLAYYLWFYFFVPLNSALLCLQYSSLINKLKNRYILFHLAMQLDLFKLYRILIVQTTAAVKQQFYWERPWSHDCTIRIWRISSQHPQEICWFMFRGA